MNYNKKCIYRRIVTLQAFRSAWMCLSHYLNIEDYNSSRDKIFEITKRSKDKNTGYDYTISFMLSDEFPVILDLDLFDIDIRVLSVQDIKRYIDECNEYGMDCPKIKFL